MPGTDTHIERDLTPVSEILEVVGEIPCPTPGCKGRGQRIRILRTHIDRPCDPCVEQLRAEDEAREHADRVQSLLDRAGCTPLMEGWSLDTYPADEHGRAARAVADEWLSRYESGDRCNLLLFGDVGGGKSGLAWGIVRALCEREVEARFVNFREMLLAMKEAFRHGEPTEKAMNVGRVPVLALDDVGSERPTDWAREELLALVDFRYARKLPTIFTSNFDPDDLVRRLGHDEPVIGKRIVSRMSDGAMQHRVRARDRRLG